jgi:hypothetical protein
VELYDDEKRRYGGGGVAGVSLKVVYKVPKKAVWTI